MPEEAAETMGVLGAVTGQRWAVRRDSLVGGHGTAEGEGEEGVPGRGTIYNQR